MTSFSWFQDQKSWYTTGSCSTGMIWLGQSWWQGLQQGAPGQAVVRDSQPAVAGGQAGQTLCTGDVRVLLRHAQWAGPD